jgi:hypothetical protein
MIKAIINDKNGGSLEVKGTPVDITADFAFLTNHIVDAFTSNGMQKDKAVNMLAKGFAAAINAECVVKRIASDNEPTDEECSIEPGDHFYYNDYEYVLLDVTDNGDYFAIVAEALPERSFNESGEDGCNNWQSSDLREWLNGDYYTENFKEGHLVHSRSNLEADNGDTKYGTCEDFVTLLSCNQYRKYRDIVPKYDNWVWTLTPWHCNVGYAYGVCYVNLSGTFGNYYATISIGVAPACTFNHKVLNPRRQAQTGRIYLAESEDV